VERLNVQDAVDQAIRDCGGKGPGGGHKRGFRRGVGAMGGGTVFRFFGGEVFGTRIDANGPERGFGEEFTEGNEGNKEPSPLTPLPIRLGEGNREESSRGNREEQSQA